MRNEIGYIHSFESFSAVDGPGIRVVVFFQGCFLRCIYCHNPDTWESGCGKEISAVDLIKKIEEYRGYIKNGGITFSGGEPLLQPLFLESLISLCKERGFHTAIETAASVALENVRHIVEKADLLIVDLKGLLDSDCKRICRIEIERVFKFLRFCEEKRKSVWIRHVVVPGYSLDYVKLREIAIFLKGFRNIERVELLPFHKMGEYKWKKLAIPYTLYDVDSPTEEEMEKCNRIFKEEGLKM